MQDELMQATSVLMHALMMLCSCSFPLWCCDGLPAVISGPAGSVHHHKDIWIGKTLWPVLPDASDSMHLNTWASASTHPFPVYVSDPVIIDHISVVGGMILETEHALEPC